MENVSIRLMNLSDICDVVKIENESFSMPWSYEAFEESLSKDYAVFYVAEIKDNDVFQIAGYVGVYHLGSECDITNIAISSSYRRMGIAELLMKAVEDYGFLNNVERVNLEVRESNIPAINLYKKMKYENIGIRKNFYEKPIENAVIMIRKLIST